MRVSRLLMLLGSGALVAACSESPTSSNQPAPTPSYLDVAGSGGSHIHLMPTVAHAVGLDFAKPGGGARTSNTGISYHGGPILPVTHVVAIYWGTSTIYTGGPTPGASGGGSQDGSLIGYFLSNLGGSSYFNINTTYYNGSNVHVQNSVSYDGFYADNSTPGSAPSDAAIQAEVDKLFKNGSLTYNASTLYAVFTGSGVNLGGGFGSSYCAYHGHFTSSQGDTKYAAMPYDYQFPTACSALSGSPNGDFAADAEVNTLAHETEETTTDPDLNAWYDRRGEENADKCAWNFGTTHTASNGAIYNITVGGKQFLVQMNWINSGSGGCRQGL